MLDVRKIRLTLELREAGISDSKNDDAKKKLRAAKNKLDVLKSAIEILESN